MTAGNGAVSRRLPSWIESFCEYTAGIQSPEIFRRWAAVSIIAGALERKVWARVFSRTLYPNIYVLLVGGPAIGKTESIREVLEFWRGLKDFHVAPPQVSRASLTDAINEAERQVFRPQDKSPLNQFNSLSAAVTEFGVFLSAYEQGFMSFLNDLYDCVPTGDKKRGMKEEIKIPAPQLNLLAGTTPAWLGQQLPQQAWAEGFTSRLLLVYSQERVRIDPWSALQRNPKLFEDLTHDLFDIHSLWGQFQFEDEVATHFRAWYMAGCLPVPEHPKLEHYLPRRHIHFLKIAMAVSASRSSELVIRLDDYQEAMNILTQAEMFMPEVFKSMNYGGDTPVMDEAFRYVWQLYSKEKRPIPEGRVIHFLSQRAPAYACQKILETMVQSGMFEIAEVGVKGQNGLRPGVKPS